MLQRCAILCGVLLLAGAAVVRATLTTPVEPQTGVAVEAAASRYYLATFQGGKRASVVVIGKGESALGLYVLDEFGNCVAWDDLGAPRTMKDLAVEWYPPRTASYTIEVRNFGPLRNVFSIAIR